MSKIDEMRRQREAQDARRKADERAAKPARPSSTGGESSGAGAGGGAKVVPIRRAAGNDNAAVESTLEVPATDAPAKEAKASGTRSSTKSRAGTDESGKCSHCGKVKSLSGGLVAQHQKGLGKMCPGSRKAPV